MANPNAAPGPVPAAKAESSTFYRSCEISLMEPVGSMSISPANRDVVLAARKGLFILDLDDPYVPPRFLAHMTTWEAVDIQWNPHPARSNWVASTSNQKLLVWNLDRPGDPRAAAAATPSGVGPLLSRLPLQSSYPPMASSSPLTSRLSAQHQAAFVPVVRSANSGTAASTGLGHMSTNSPFAQTLAHSSTASHFGGGGTSVPRSSAIEHILHAHTRAITDINWSAFHPEVLASCSLDTWTWVWDLRMSSASADSGRRKPAQGYSAWNAAVTQVKFNRASEHRLASTCDNKVLIWDDRKGSLPLATIEAHESKIYSIDWSRDTSLGLDRLITCSLDRTVKFWDLSSESAQRAIGARELITEAESVIETNTPVWRARHLPFGNGVMTLPQRGDCSLSMWAKDHPEAPMATFEGHTDIVKEYLFRTKGGQNRDCDDRRFQLITWSKDQTLRLWPVSEEQTRSVGHKPGAPIRVLNTRAYAPDISYRDPPQISAIVPDDRALHDSGDLGSTSSVTVSSIMPPEKVTRSLLSGRGAGGGGGGGTGGSSRINGTSPYSSSQSGFQNIIRDGRASPVAAFSSSFGQRPLDRRVVHHSSSQSSLRGDLAAARRQGEMLPRSLGRAELYGRSLTGLPGSSLPRGIPAAAAAAAAADSAHNPSKAGTSFRSARLPASNKSGSSFKLPDGLREGAVSKIPAGVSARKMRPGRSHPIQEEADEAGHHKHSRLKDKQRERDHTLAKDADPTSRRKKTGRRALGAPMRLDRARLAGPAVDPIGWIANVRIQKDSGEDSKQVSDDATNGRGSGLDMSRQPSGMGTGASAGETDREDGLSSQRLGDEIVALSRKLPRILFEKAEVAQRTCTLSMYGPWADREPAFLRITIVFPRAYPRLPPSFDLERSANITLKTRAYLLRGLSRLAKQSAQLERPCIELCCRFLLGEPVKLLDGDDGEGGNASHRALSVGSITDSEDDMGPVRPRMKMPARRMGASFGPHGELVVFGQRPINDTSPGSRSSSRARHHAEVERDKDLRRSSVAPSRSRSKSRPRVREMSRIPSEMEESRFLRSYTALSSAMSSLARYSKEGNGGDGGGDHGLRDSDVVQLMSSDFFARRLLSRGGTRRSSQERSRETSIHSGGEEPRRPSLAGLTPLTAAAAPSSEKGSETAASAAVAAPLQAIDRLHERHHASEGSSSMVRIYYPFVGRADEAPSFHSSSSAAAAAAAAETRMAIKPPPFLRKRSNSLPCSPHSPRTSSPLREAAWQAPGPAGQDGRYHGPNRRHRHHAADSTTATATATPSPTGSMRRTTARFSTLVGGTARDDLHLP
ncbi:uncharacterized protein PFL1_05699 [Pseudozyma flocculosa PF-1]|uniref:Related to MTC5 - subunit of the SEA complex n=2 Tax=Pseudozyma flocculosa TaxID=84751 RepID=A0A5C3F941_9BASI|nr:uncharacterized protein PFL1_05699 [Pseudozyma flocculosa PF-1]EPQ26720.1 hypothetical protein PFL1_05699 [Pseudozyma flocculosa PF-1]SPO40958.1 related to MTC5 - subunit of the SEA complex [Pseudozyma flocculosa]